MKDVAVAAVQSAAEKAADRVNPLTSRALHVWKFLVTLHTAPLIWDTGPPHSQVEASDTLAFVFVQLVHWRSSQCPIGIPLFLGYVIAKLGLFQLQ